MGLRPFLPAYVVLTVCSLLCSAVAQDAESAGLGQQAANVLLNVILNNLASPTPPPVSRPRCVPYKLPANYTTFQDYCKFLSIANDTIWDAKYGQATQPRAMGEHFPLNGCVLGCIVGKDSFARAMRWGAGAWSGKWCVPLHAFKFSTHLILILNHLIHFDWKVTVLPACLCVYTVFVSQMW